MKEREREWERERVGEAGGRDRRTGQAVGGRECTREKLEPHTLMWGKT